MSRRKSRQRPAQGQVQRRPLAATPTPPARRGRWLLIGVAVAGCALALAGLFVWLGTRTTATTPNRPVGAVNSCAQTPPFARDHGFGKTAVLDTQARNVRGLMIYEPGNNGQPAANPPPYRHPSWSSAGYLGAPVIDRDGTIYVAPAPWINTLYNPPDRANTIYRIDPHSAEMTALVSLPPAAPTNGANAYGIMALAYDCDTHSLYVSSVYGSTRSEEHGRLFRVDLATKQATLLRDGVDPFGLAVFNGAHGKRLYYGLARAPQIFSIALDAAGNATGDPRQEADFEGQGVRGDERARRIDMKDNLTMVAKLVQFDFTLTAPTDPRQSTLTYLYDPSHDRWVLQDIPAAN